MLLAHRLDFLNPIVILLCGFGGLCRMRRMMVSRC